MWIPSEQTVKLCRGIALCVGLLMAITLIVFEFTIGFNIVTIEFFGYTIVMTLAIDWGFSHKWMKK